MSRKGILVFIFFIVATMLVPACGGGGSGSSSSNDNPGPPPPDAPIALSATTICSDRIDLSWTDNSDNETGFKIERKTGVAGTYSQIATVGAGVTAFSDSGLSAATEYYYQVRASNSGGDSGYSNDDYATTISKVIYAAEGGGQISDWNFYCIDAATGAATVIGPIGYGVTGMDFGPGGILYATTSEGKSPPARPYSLITIDPATGAGTLPIWPTDDAGGTNYAFRDITFVNTVPYGSQPCQLASFDETTGLVTPNLGLIPGAPSCSGAGIAADAGSSTVYFLRESGLLLHTIIFGPVTFIPGPILSNGVLGKITAATFHEGTLFVMESDGSAGSRQLLTVNTADGVMTAVGLTLTSSWISAIASRVR